MASFVTKKVAKHVLKENAENRFGTDDPYFEHVAAVDMHGRATGKYEKRKRAIPPGLTKQEEKVLKKVTRRAYRLDNCMNFCGIRLGWSAIIGLIPAAGDIIDSLMAFMVVWTATQADIPATLKSRMVANIALDFAVGLVPFLGDVADAFFRCNTRNAALLWKHLQDRGAKRIEEGHSGPAIRSSSQKRTGRSPGRNMQEALPAGSRNPSQKGERLTTTSQPRGRSEYPMNEKVSAHDPRPHSSRRGNGGNGDRLPQPQAQGGGRYVTSQDISTNKSSSVAKGKGWRSWLSGSSAPSSDLRDLENGDHSRRL